MNIGFCFILSHKQMRSVFNSLLIALAIFDTLYLLFEINEQDYLSIRSNFVQVSDMYNLLFPKILFPLRAIMFYNSIFMTVAISLERYIAVTRPISLHLQMRDDKKAQVLRFLKYLVPVFVISVIATMPTFFELDANYNNATQVFEYDETIHKNTPEYQIDYIGITTIICTTLIPFATILYLNTSTYRTIFTKRKNQAVVNNGTQNINDGSNDSQFLRRHIASNEGKQAQEEKLFVIFFFSSVLFLVCHFPRFILDFYNTLYRKEIRFCAKAGFLDPPLWVWYLFYFHYFLVIINSSLNSAIYCLFSSKYRIQVEKCLTCFNIFK